MSKYFVSSINPVPRWVTDYWSAMAKPGDQLRLGHRLGAWFTDKDIPFVIFSNISGNVHAELCPVPASCAPDAPATPEKFRRIWVEHFGKEIHPLAEAIISAVASISLAAPDAAGQAVLGFVLTRGAAGVARWQIVPALNVQDIIEAATWEVCPIPEAFCALVCNFERNGFARDGFRLAALFGGEDEIDRF